MSPHESTSTTHKPQAAAMFNTVMNELDIFDVAAMVSDNPAPTWFRHRRFGTHARYDRAYVTRGFLSNIKFLHRRRLLGDHTPIEVIINQTAKTGSLWKFPDHLLDKSSFLEQLHNKIRNVIGQFVEQQPEALKDYQYQINFDDKDPAMVLSTVIQQIIQHCKEQTMQEKRVSRQQVDAKVQQVIDRRNELDSVSPSVEQVEAYEEAVQELRIVQARRQKAAANINMINYATKGERVSRYNFARYSKGNAAREIVSLQIGQGVDMVELVGDQIANFMFEKYEKLLRQDHNDNPLSIQEFLGPALVQSLPKCPDDEKCWLTMDVQGDELAKVVKELKVVSAPGPMGMSNLLIREIFPFIEEILLRYGNHLLFGDNPNIFILKPGKGAIDPDSYRGISMLEVIFKMYSKVLASRMKRAMCFVQNPQQFGFTQGKGILEASRTVLDVIQDAVRSRKPLIVLSTDFYKVNSFVF